MAYVLLNYVVVVAIKVTLNVLVRYLYNPQMGDYIGLDCLLQMKNRE